MSSRAGGRGLPSWLSPVWLVVGSIISVQVGAAFAKSLFVLTAATAVAWLRMAVRSPFRTHGPVTPAMPSTLVN